MEKKDCCNNGNPSHQKEISRINRILGQLEGVKRMIEDNRYCPEILIQLKAIRSAVRSVESNILKTHLNHCVVQSFDNEEDKLKKIEEIQDLFHKFDSI
ncbi:MAG: Copper-sensing transcriptional repressor CsoR [Alphaproteobacteria bacterium ADurb.Bin438]|nr:MAG: Copper-sensing transcriptional repressor CsoR [Alphaproteobacteria bacterium ADurb.Bin438]